jgi:hypothetical protein
MNVLPGPERNQVKIWFQGATGSGKSLLSNFVREKLEELGIEVTDIPEWQGGFVDLSKQDGSDVITVKLDRAVSLQKLIMRRVREPA